MIAIMDYKAGNVTSVLLAVQHCGGTATITADPAVIAAAERVIFPGVGAAGQCMTTLNTPCGPGDVSLGEVLRAVVARGTPVLAICVGMQLIFDHSDEDGGVPCLGLLPGRVKRFTVQDVKIPHMGWNAVSCCQPHPLLTGLPADAEAYFVHSYRPDPADPQQVFATCDYGDARFACAVGRDNLFATQFHPEKSGPIGLRILGNFLRWQP